MKYCKECGNGLSEQAQFCKECGAPVKDKMEVGSPISKESSPVRKPLSRKMKIQLIVGAAVILLLFGAYKAGEVWTDKNRLIEQVETAIHEQDGKALARLLKSTDENLVINEKTIVPLMKVLEEHADEADYAIEGLKQQSRYFDASEEYAEDSELLQLQQTGKLLFYDLYEVTIQPFYMNISTDYADTALYVEGEEIEKNKKNPLEAKAGPFLPGYYTVKGKLKNDYLDMKTEEQVFLWGNKSEDVYLSIPAETITLESDFNHEDIDVEGTIFINGKQVKGDAFAQPEIGPVLTDGTLDLQVAAHFPWGEMKSEVIPIEDSTVYFDFSEDETLKTVIKDTVVAFEDESIQAVTSGNLDVLVSASDEYRKYMLTNILEPLQSAGEFYTGTYKGSTFDLDSFQLGKNEEWKAQITANGNYYSDYFYPEYEEAELSDHSSATVYYLVFDTTSKKWLIDETSSTYWFSDNHTEEYIVENPVEYTTQWKPKDDEENS